MGSRLARWFIFNFVFALIPLGAAILIRLLVNKLTIADMENNFLEILFFGFMTSITTLADLDEIDEMISKNILLYLVKWFLIITSSYLAILYGASLLESIAGLNLSGFRRIMLWSSISVSSILFIVGTSIQIFISKVISSLE